MYFPAFNCVTGCIPFKYFYLPCSWDKELFTFRGSLTQNLSTKKHASGIYLVQQRFRYKSLVLINTFSLLYKDKRMTFRRKVRLFKWWPLIDSERKLSIVQIPGGDYIPLSCPASPFFFPLMLLEVVGLIFHPL